MPGGAGLGATLTQVRRDHRPEMVHPAPNCLIRDRDPALRQQIFNVAEAQGESKIEPDRGDSHWVVQTRRMSLIWRISVASSAGYMHSTRSSCATIVRGVPTV